MKTILLLSVFLSASAQAAVTRFSAHSSYEESVQGYSAEELESEVDAIEVVAEAPAPGMEIEAVSNTTTLKLLGRGIAARGGRDSLAIACYFGTAAPSRRVSESARDENCPAVRFVWFKTAGEAYYIGEVLVTPVAPSDGLRKKSLKLVLRDFFQRHQTAETERRERAHGGKAFFLIVVTATAVAISIPTTAGGAIIGGWTVGMKPLFVMVGMYFLLTNDRLTEYFISGAIMDARMTDEKGWNWEAKPKRVSKKNYRLVLSQIVKGGELHRDARKRDKLWRQSERLEKQGVIFQENIGY